MTAFTHFTNPYQDPANIPDKYRHHLRLPGLFQPDGRYTRPAEDPVTMWAIDLLHSKYESAREAAARSLYKVVLSQSTPGGIETGLRPLTRDKFREVLGDTRSGCHSILRDNEGLQPQEAVDAMVKFLFANTNKSCSKKISGILPAQLNGQPCPYSQNGRFPDPVPLNPDDPDYSIDKGQPGDLCPPCAKQNLSQLGHWQKNGAQPYPEKIHSLRLFKCRQWFWLVVPGLHQHNPSSRSE